MQNNAPDQIVLTKLTPNTITQPGDVILCDNTLFQIATHGTPAHEFELPVYRTTTTTDNNTDEAA